MCIYMLQNVHLRVHKSTPGPPRDGSTRAQRMRREEPSSGHRAQLLGQQGLSLSFPEQGLLSRSRCRPPNSTPGHQGGAPRAERACLFSKWWRTPAPAGPGRQCRRPAWGMFLESSAAPRDGHAFQASPPRPDSQAPRGSQRLLSPKRETGRLLPPFALRKDCSPRPGGLARVTGGGPAGRVSVLTCALASALILPAPVGTKPLEFKSRKGSGAAGTGPKEVGKPRG